jgi:hypothetical protein
MKDHEIARSLTASAIFILSFCLLASALGAQGTGGLPERGGRKTRQHRFPACRMGRRTWEERTLGKAFGFSDKPRIIRRSW